jgi:Spy/CpxP family protein refolding chaperone
MRNVEHKGQNSLSSDRFSGVEVEEQVSPRSKNMKAKLILIVILMTVIPASTSAQTKSGDDSAATNPSAAPDGMAPDAGSPYVPAGPGSPGPPEASQVYQAVMVAITQNFSANLAGITEAVQQGKMSSEEGKTSSAQQYLIAQMQFQLLTAWRQMEKQNLAKVPAPDDKSDASPTDDNEIVLVEPPFSSFQLTEGVAEHLSLTQSQKKAIQQVMTLERHRMDPLMAQLRSEREKVLALDPQRSNKKEIKTLADAQAALLAKFIVDNARMQSEIYKLLTPEQQRKLDDLKRSGESGTVASR